MKLLIKRSFINWYKIHKEKKSSTNSKASKKKIHIKVNSMLNYNFNLFSDSKKVNSIACLMLASLE